MGAAKKGHIDIVKVLIASGADLNAKDNYGNTALKLAANAGHIEIVELLKEFGAGE
jgi:ankyrin repeat protein